MQVISAHALHMADRLVAKVGGDYLAGSDFVQTIVFHVVIYVMSLKDSRAVVAHRVRALSCEDWFMGIVHRMSLPLHGGSAHNPSFFKDPQYVPLTTIGSFG